MAIDLNVLVGPGHTALVTSEVQQGVVGKAGVFPELTAAAKAVDLVAHAAELCTAARTAGVPVIHGLAARRADGLGSNTNARLFAAARRSPVPLLPGSAEASVVPELGPEPEDFLLTRLHGLNPMAGTDLDPLLRNLGVTTIVVVGVSLNVAIVGLVMDAVNLGYQVVVPRDAVAGVPVAYAETVLDNTLSVLATITTTAEVVAAWPEPSA
jgi:nicotinamidase-related amidase